VLSGLRLLHSLSTCSVPSRVSRGLPGVLRQHKDACQRTKDMRRHPQPVIEELKSVALKCSVPTCASAFETAAGGCPCHAAELAV